jgi:hypothetical protein
MNQKSLDKGKGIKPLEKIKDCGYNEYVTIKVNKINEIIDAVNSLEKK